MNCNCRKENLEATYVKEEQNVAIIKISNIRIHRFGDKLTVSIPENYCCDHGNRYLTDQEIEEIGYFETANFSIQAILKYLIKIGYMPVYKKSEVVLFGGSYLSSGYVYAPYVPLQMASLMDPSDVTFRKGLRTRYAKKVNRNFIGAIKIEATK